ncbi:IgD binding protein/hemagglutinin MID [Canicola haemoglobinophilus]|uniref:IgD binding protein/hemagglutinin MID n=1 Tax=Canicola haemoglobinophilus TaxID=733 RepID=A0AB38HB83_9PAST|nr:IgD binding protein/hemagglutinin MID [Canicola haemoglobinophilus]STO69415.1 IgD binding protein/hemagglutinin MID [Canicola haemoglobinophilus]
MGVYTEFGMGSALAVRVVKTVVNAMTGAVNYDLSVTAKAPEFTFGVGTRDEIKFKDGGHLNIVGGSDAIETKVDGNTIKVDLSEAGKATLAKVNNGIHSQTDDGKTLNYQLGDTIKVTGDGKNLTTTTTAEGKVSVRLKDDVKVNSVTTGNVSISTQGINAGGNKVVNVANGHIRPTSKDAVNGSQLYATNIQVNQNTQNIANLGERVNHLDNKINRVNKDLRAGVAGSAAIAGLPQVRGHGKSMIAASTGNYKGQNAIAIGYSRASDNGKVLFKLSGSANTQGDIVSSIGLGYEW